jgi:hypothetical protein
VNKKTFSFRFTYISKQLYIVLLGHFRAFFRLYFIVEGIYLEKPKYARNGQKKGQGKNPGRT